MSAFLEMGGHAAFVWPCYLLTLAGMVWLAVASWQRAKDAAAKLEEMSGKAEKKASTP
jgi:heme exporter protein CcmD